MFPRIRFVLSSLVIRHLLFSSSITSLACRLHFFSNLFPSFLCLSIHLVFLLFSSVWPAQEGWSLACCDSVPCGRAGRSPPVRLPPPPPHQTMCFPLAGCCGNHRSFPCRGLGCGTWTGKWQRKGSCCAVFPNGSSDSGFLHLPEAHPGSFVGRPETVWGPQSHPAQTLILVSGTFATKYQNLLRGIHDSPLSLPGVIIVN